MTVKIRIARREDVPALFDIRTSVRENQMDLEQLAKVGVTTDGVAEMIRTNSRAWIAEVDGVAAAFSMANREQATIFAMFVRPGYEGQGLGQALMQKAERWLGASGCREIWLLTSGDPSIRAHGFYQRIGWTSIGAQPDGQVRYVKNV